MAIQRATEPMWGWHSCRPHLELAAAAGRGRRLARMQQELLHAPVQDFTDEKRILGRTSNLMDPTEFLHLAAALADVAEHLAMQAQLINTARIAVRAVQVLGWARRDTDCPGCSILRVDLFLSEHIAHPRMQSGRGRHVDL